jgi:hypothetical protein
VKDENGITLDYFKLRTNARAVSVIMHKGAKDAAQLERDNLSLTPVITCEGTR